MKDNSKTFIQIYVYLSGKYNLKQKKVKKILDCLELLDFIETDLYGVKNDLYLMHTEYSYNYVDFENIDAFINKNFPKNIDIKIDFNSNIEKSILKILKKHTDGLSFMPLKELVEKELDMKVDWKEFIIYLNYLQDNDLILCNTLLMDDFSVEYYKLKN